MTDAGTPTARSGLFLPLFDELADPALVVRLCVAAEDAGWHGVFVWDHVRWREPIIDVADPWITLTAIAAATERVRVGPMVTPLAAAGRSKSPGRPQTLGVGLGSDRFGSEFSITGEQVDDKRRAQMLDEALQILTTAWSGEPVHHRGEHYTVDGMRFLPRPVQQPGIPVWVGGYYGSRAPLRRAARYQGFVPVNLEHPDQLAEIVADLTALRRADGTTDPQPYDIVVDLEPGCDPAPYIEAGATWCLVGVSADAARADLVRAIIRDGPIAPA